MWALWLRDVLGAILQRRSAPVRMLGDAAFTFEHIPFLLEDDKTWILGRTAMTIWSFATSSQ